MGAFAWIAGHWVDLLQSVGIIGGLVFTAHSIRKEARARQIGNMMAAAQQHHAIWKELYDRPHLLRVVDENAVLDEKPITDEEQMFVSSIIIHLDSIHRAIKAKMFLSQEGLRRDVKGFLSRPVPKAIWEKLRPLQDRDFVEFIEECLRGE
jgi:hypothetical protein